MADISQILAERGNRYGNFADHAMLSQSLQRLIFSHMNRINPQQLEPYMVEALTMICHKLARIANGDPKYIDSWRDISAYSHLVVEGLQTTEGATDAVIRTIINKDREWLDINSITKDTNV